MKIREKDVTAELPVIFDCQASAALGLIGRCRIIGVHPDGRREDITDGNYWDNLSVKRSRNYVRVRPGPFQYKRLNDGSMVTVERSWADLRVLRKAADQ